jgi:CDP-paratose 2-epimerase
MRRHGKRASNVVIGGCGFIGSNLADSLLSEGEAVTVVDNLSRPGVESNLEWLQQRHGERLTAEIIDIRSQPALGHVISDAKAVYHLAAQTAVTTSLTNPTADFEINARGTLNVLEAVRAAGGGIPVVFASTNKVYGALSNVETNAVDGHHLPVDLTVRAHGIDEKQPLDFSTPYGCSKGVADQYVLDYARSYGLRTAVLRMSCIYGPRQYGTEDQGWVAHFLMRALTRRPITIFGDGQQVRDILHVSDAVNAYRALMDKIDCVQGRALNLGGGPENAVSLNLLLSKIARITGRELDVRRAEPRTGDQLYFVADTREIRALVGWQAHIDWRQGIKDLAEWLDHFRLGKKPLGRIVA